MCCGSRANVSLLQIELQLATSKRLTWPADANLLRIKLKQKEESLGLKIGTYMKHLYEIVTKDVLQV